MHLSGSKTESLPREGSLWAAPLPLPREVVADAVMRAETRESEILARHREPTELDNVFSGPRTRESLRTQARLIHEQFGAYGLSYQQALAAIVADEADNGRRVVELIEGAERERDRLGWHVVESATADFGRVCAGERPSVALRGSNRESGGSCNTRTRGSRRVAKSSRAGPDDDPGEPSRYLASHRAGGGLGRRYA